MAAQPEVVYVTHAPPPYVGPGMNATVVVSSPVTPEPMITTCRSCHAQIVTRTQKNAATKTHLCACILFLFICWPCVCVPYCMDSCNNVDHYCPNCNAYIGGYRF